MFSLAYGQTKPGTYTLNGKIAGVTIPTKAYLQYIVTGGAHTESAEVKNGVFVFSGHIDAPVRATLTFDHDGSGPHNDGKPADTRIVYLDNENFILTATDSIKTASISGSKINKEYLRYRAMLAPTQKAIAIASAAYKDESSLVGMEKIMAEERAQQVIYARQNPHIYFSLEALTEISIYGIDVKEIRPIFNNLSPVLRASPEGIAFAKILKTAGTTSLGSVAPPFTQNDVNGKSVRLSDFRGQYVLLDFWASWCNPCRTENPKVVRAYQQFKDKNFTVLGVSLDQQSGKAAWLAAIKKDGLTWTHVSDLNYWDNAVAKQYGIKSIPQNFLIDPRGKIIGRNLHGEDLIAKLTQLLK